MCVRATLRGRRCGWQALRRRPWPGPLSLAGAGAGPRERGRLGLLVSQPPPAATCGSCVPSGWAGRAWHHAPACLPRSLLVAKWNWGWERGHWEAGPACTLKREVSRLSPPLWPSLLSLQDGDRTAFLQGERPPSSRRLFQSHQPAAHNQTPSLRLTLRSCQICRWGRGWGFLPGWPELLGPLGNCPAGRPAAGDSPGC